MGASSDAGAFGSNFWWEGFVLSPASESRSGTPSYFLFNKSLAIAASSRSPCSVTLHRKLRFLLNPH